MRTYTITPETTPFNMFQEATAALRPRLLAEMDFWQIGLEFEKLKEMPLPMFYNVVVYTYACSGGGHFICVDLRHYVDLGSAGLGLIYSQLTAQPANLPRQISVSRRLLSGKTRAGLSVALEMVNALTHCFVKQGETPCHSTGPTEKCSSV